MFRNVNSKAPKKQTKKKTEKKIHKMLEIKFMSQNLPIKLWRIVDDRDFLVRVHGFANPDQFMDGFQMLHELAQVGKVHPAFSLGRRWKVISRPTSRE